MKAIKLFAVVALSLFTSMAVAQQKEIILLAHRGGLAEGMENTLGTFQKALDAGIKAFELDVRITKDGKIVLQHDNTLKRTAGLDRTVEDMTEKELREVTLSDGSKLAFLDEVLALFGKHSNIYIEFELKCSKYNEELLIGTGYLDKVAKAVLKAEPKGSTYILSSFNTRALRYIKEKYPTAEIMYITKNGCTQETLNTAAALGAKRIAARLDKTSRDDMKKAHKQGFTVNLWPGRSEADLVCAWAVGADIHCTDLPIAGKAYAENNLKWITIK